LRESVLSRAAGAFFFAVAARLRRTNRSPFFLLSGFSAADFARFFLWGVGGGYGLSPFAAGRTQPPPFSLSPLVFSLLPVVIHCRSSFTQGGPSLVLSPDSRAFSFRISLARKPDQGLLRSRECSGLKKQFFLPPGCAPRSPKA